MTIAMTQPMYQSSTFGWISIVRLGLVQAAIGAIVVMTTSTLNRIMVVELALPASLPGLLVAIHYFVQVIRPRMGFESDIGAKRTPWIIGAGWIWSSYCHNTHGCELNHWNRSRNRCLFLYRYWCEYERYIFAGTISKGRER